jgi:hypothetical protein
MRRILFALLVSTLLATSANADVVPGEPLPECPPGVLADSCHGGSFCNVKFCTSAADCRSDQECREVQACLFDLSCERVGTYQRPDADPVTWAVKSLCPASGLSADQKPCKAVKVCVSPAGTSTSVATSTDTVPPSQMGETGCTCRIGGWANAKSVGPWLLVGLVGAAMTLLRRRRR